jgi:hypothetical protein
MIKLIGVCLLSIATLGGCDLMSHTHCDDEILTQHRSPDGNYVAVLYHRSCANKTGLYTCVNIKEASGAVSSQGETQPILTLRGFHEINAIWINQNSLEITSTGLKDQRVVLTQENNWKDIKISYKN